MWQPPTLWGALRPPLKQCGAALGGPRTKFIRNSYKTAPKSTTVLCAVGIPWGWMLPHMEPYTLLLVSCMAPQLHGCARVALAGALGNLILEFVTVALVLS